MQVPSTCLSSWTMDIEEALQQQHFANEWHKLRVNLLHSSSWLKSLIKEFLEPHGLTQQQFNILRILRGQHPAAISTLDIRGRMVDRMSDASRLVDRLQKKGLVMKRPCKQDGRLVDVHITEQGLSLLAEVDARLNHLDTLTQGGLTVDEARALNRLLDKMRRVEVA